MNVFADAIDRIFSHAFMATSALWISSSSSEERTIRVIRHSLDRITEFG